MNRLTNEKTYDLVVLSLMIAIEVILILTPLGYIPIGGIRATTLHIPVMLAGILLGYNLWEKPTVILQVLLSHMYREL